MRKIVKSLFHLFGLEVLRLKKRDLVSDKILKIIEAQKIDYVIDIGANEGQYALRLLEAGYNGDIFSIEPLSEVYPKLKANSRAWDNWHIADRMALGDCSCIKEIHVAGNLQSSSILDMCKTHTDCAPGTEYINSEDIEVKRLDEIISKEKITGKNIFLKIDSQGYESNILDGAGTLLDNIVGIQLELSTIELYKGQILYLDLMKKLESKGFYLRQVFPGMYNIINGELYQFDGIFIKTRKL